MGTNILEQLMLDFFLETMYEPLEFNKDDVCGIYAYGSRVYGTHTENSDYDYVIIVDSPNMPDYKHWNSEYLDIHFITKNYFKVLLEKCDIMALECFYQKNPIKKCEVDFTINLVNLRKSISAICSNSWVKAKKKVLLETEDNYIGYKSLFHSFRILLFGIAIAKNNEIDFQSGNVYWDRIMTMVANGEPIEEIMSILKSEHNALATEFRLLAPKE